MKISLNWLSDYIELTEKDHAKIKEIITANSAEIETMESMADKFGNVVIGRILKFEKHPDADKLHVAKVDVGKKEPIQLIFGSMVKMKVGDRVPVAIAPTTLPSGLTIGECKVRGIDSEGMLCLDQELGLKDEGVSIMYFPDEKPGTPLAKAMELDDVVIDIDNHAITNRSDLFSHRGFAREFVANGLAKWKKGTGVWKIPENNTPPPIEVDIKEHGVCSRYCAVYITGIQVQESPKWIQRRLEAVGIRPINNIVDITNYVMMAVGMPLHAFDKEKLVGKKHVMRFSKKGEKVTTLDEIDRELPEGVVILADEKEIYDLCGIMGGHQSSISPKTDKIWLHAPIFDGTLVRRASRAMSHISEASVIYEKGVYNEIAMDALELATKLILENSPGSKVASKVVDIKNYKSEERVLTLRKSQLDRLVGADIPKKEVEKILTDLGFTNKSTTDGWSVTVPSWRLNDVKMEADLIEEVARIYGYDNIPFKSPEVESAPPPILPRRVYEREVKDALVGLGFDELCTFAFLGPELLAKCDMKQTDEMIELLNPISSDISLMRQSLLPRTLETIADNLRYHQSFRVFEVSKTYHKKDEQPKENTTLIMATVGEDFRELQGVVEHLGLTTHPTSVCEDSHPRTRHPGRQAALVLRDQSVGHLYEVHPKILKNFDIKSRVVVAEVNLEAIHEMKIERRPKYEALPKFPSVKLDVSIAIPRRDLAEKYFKTILKTDKTLIRNIDLIDEYTGEKMEKGKRALTYSITYQANDRTLTEDEVSAIHEKVIGNLKKDGAAIR